jgi:predicted HD phosphohydrolase
MATTAPFGYQKDEKDHNHLVIDEVTAPVVELIFSIAEEGVGLHTICNRLRKAKVIKPSFHKKEMFERYIDEEKCMTGTPLMSARYYMTPFMQETLP